MKIFRLTDKLFEENAYIIVREKDVTIIDPGFNYNKIVTFLDENNLSLNRIILTHGHIDHINDIDKLSSKYKDVPIYINEFDADFLLDSSLNCSRQFGNPKVFSENLNIIPVDGNAEIDGFSIYHTPGHTRGSMIIKISDKLFTGDTLFKESVGRTDLPTGSMKVLEESLTFILKTFKKDTTVYPGHYDKTTIKDELLNNTYLKKKNKGIFRR